MDYAHTTRTLRISFDREDNVFAEVHIGEKSFIPRRGDLFRLDWMDHVDYGNDERRALKGQTFSVKNVLAEYVLRGQGTGEMFRVTIILEKSIDFL